MGPDPKQILLNALAGTRALHALRRARDVFRPVDHQQVVQDVLARLGQRRRSIGDGRIAGAALLEIGSGREMGLGLLLLALGARRVVNVEIEPYGFIDDAGFYRLLAGQARAAGVDLPWPIPGLRDGGAAGKVAPDGDRMVVHLGRSAAAIPEPDEAFDVTFSVSVLQHIRRRDLPTLAAELHRVTRRGGRGYHRVDLAAMRGHPLGHLRYDERAYAAMYGNRDLYVNRYRMDDLEAVFRAAGFDVCFEDVRLLDDRALLDETRAALAPEFAGKAPEILLAHSAMMVLGRAA